MNYVIASSQQSKCRPTGTPHACAYTIWFFTNDTLIQQQIPYQFGCGLEHHLLSKTSKQQHFFFLYLLFIPWYRILIKLCLLDTLFTFTVY